MKKAIIAVCAAVLLAAAAAEAQKVRLDDVVRHLKNPDPEMRLKAVRILREQRHTDAIVPMAALINDPIDQIQGEAIDAELAFFLPEGIVSHKQLAYAPEVFEAGPLLSWPRPVPAALIAALLKATEDEHPAVRVEAIYALGTIARAPFPQEFDQALIAVLDHYDPAMRAAGARVVARLGVRSATDALIKGVNDSNPDVRFASMRALGFLREERAIHALTEQLKFYRKDEGAFSAIDALARIGHTSSVPVFKSHLTNKDPFIRRAAAEGLGRSGDTTEISILEARATQDSSEMVRAAMAFALQKLGREYIGQLVSFMDSGKMAPQVGEYFLELGPSIAPALVPHLQHKDSAIRANVAQVLGVIGGDASVAALEPLTQDRDKDVVRSATRAIERIKLDANLRTSR